MERPTKAMMERDLASAALGMVVEHDEPGRAVVSMRVRDDMTNGFHITHGGLVFALADTAFAIACNEDERITVAQGADITFLKSTTTVRPPCDCDLMAVPAARAISGLTSRAEICPDEDFWRSFAPHPGGSPQSGNRGGRVRSVVRERPRTSATTSPDSSITVTS